MKKLLIILLLLFAVSSQAQIDTATWSLQRDGLGHYSILTNRITVAGVTAGTIRTPLIMSISQIDTSKFQLIRDGYGNYSVAINKASLYGIDSGKIRVGISYGLGTVRLDEENTWTAEQAFSIISSSAYKQVSVVAIADSTIDCNLSNTFSKTLGANQRFVLSNVGDGQTINIAVTNTASNYTVTWVDPDGLTIKWADATAPVLTLGAKTDVFTFVRIGAVIYGNAIQNF